MSEFSYQTFWVWGWKGKGGRWKWENPGIQELICSWTTFPGILKRRVNPRLVNISIQGNIILNWSLQPFVKLNIESPQFSLVTRSTKKGRQLSVSVCVCVWLLDSEVPIKIVVYWLQIFFTLPCTHTLCNMTFQLFLSNIRLYCSIPCIWVVTCFGW